MKNKKITPGILIKKYREQARLTQNTLAKKLGYKIPQFVCLMEKDRAAVPLEIMAKLVLILGIPEDKAIQVLRDQYVDKIKDVFASEFSNNKKIAS